MSWLLPLTVALPFAGAGFGVALDHWMPGWVKQFPALIFAVATTVCAVLALTHSGSAPVHWVGGWQPKHGIAIGIAFVGEPLGAGMAAFAGLLATAALLFSWHYMEEAPRLYRVLMLVFLGGMCGFALSGDLFNMFVFFEVMGVAAYALAGYHIEELGPLQAHSTLRSRTRSARTWCCSGRRSSTERPVRSTSRRSARHSTDTRRMHCSSSPLR